jgi:predicted dehydrogenase
VRLGIIGCGFATLDRHLPALKHVPEVHIVALADVDRERAVEAARLAGGRVLEVERLLDDGSVDAVAICTPPATHGDLAIAALDAGKHVFLEKPLAPSLEEADRIVERAAGSPLRVVVGFNFRRHRFVERARRLVASGALGEVQAVHTAFTNPIRDGAPDWKADPELGGGVLLDRAIHHFDLWRFVLAAEVAQVFALGSERSAVVGARTTRGTPLSTLVLDDSGVSHELAIYGTDGIVHADLCRVDGFHVAPRTELPGSPRARLGRARESLRAVRRGGDFRVTYEEQWRHFAEAVRRDLAPSPGLADGRAALEIALAAAASLDPVEA